MPIPQSHNILIVVSSLAIVHSGKTTDRFKARSGPVRGPEVHALTKLIAEKSNADQGSTGPNQQVGCLRCGCLFYESSHTTHRNFHT